jgi:hypothetical protein
MDSLHILGKRDYFHHKHIQESWHKDYPASQQHTTETANAKPPNP